MILKCSIYINGAAEVTCFISILEDDRPRECHTGCPDALGKSERLKTSYHVADEILEISSISFILGKHRHSDTYNSSTSGIAYHK
jgi:hypothetical protein